MISNNPVGIPSAAISAGATTPVPKEGVGAILYSTTLRELIFWTGSAWQTIATQSTGAVAGADEPYFYKSGQWLNDKALSGTTTMALNMAYAWPLVLGKSITITALDISISSASSGSNTIRIGIYNPDSGNLPGTLLTEIGTVSAGTAGFVTLTPSSPITLAAGVWWIALANQGSGSNPTVNSKQNFQSYCLPSSAPTTSNILGYIANIGTGALPATFTISGSAAAVPRTWLQTQ